jgi:ADP-ribose pyrophosphatase YjhB (NUDIX family)
VALAVLLWRDHLLLLRGEDSVKPETFYRAIGGGVDFGERAAEAVVREFREEVEREVEVIEPLGVVENIFTHEGRAGHEVDFEFMVRFAPGHEPPDLEPIEAVEHDDGGAIDGSFTAYWMPLHQVLSGEHIIYPPGFTDRLAAWLGRR